MRVLLFLALMICVSPFARAQDVLSPEQFRDRVAAAMRQVAPDADVEMDGPLKLGILFADGRGVVVDLDGHYERYLADPGALDLYAARVARVLAGLDQSGAPARDRIVALVLSQAGLAELNSAFASLHPRPLVRPFLGDLTEVLVVAIEDTYHLATPGELAELGVSAEEAWQLSRINISERLGQPRLEPFARGIVAMRAANRLGPSALTDPALCRASGAEALSFLVVDDETILLADMRQGGELAGLRDQLSRAGVTASRTILTCRGGRLVDYEGL